MIRVNPEVKFAYNLIKGSPQERREFVGNLNAKLFDSIELSMKGDMGSVESVKPILDTVLPEKKNIKVSTIPFSGDYDGSSSYIYDKKNEIIGQTLEIPAKKGKFTAKGLVAMMHEFTHPLSTLANPKYTARTIKLDRAHKYNFDYFKWYDKVLYTEKNGTSEADKKAHLDMVRNKTEKFLSGKSNEDKLDYIQDARYELEQERNAYEEQLKYAKILHSQKKQVYPTDLENNNNIYMIPEKIAMLKQIGFDVVADIRSNLAKKSKKF